MPHKSNVFSLVDQVSEEAASTNAVNTVVMQIDPSTGQTRFEGTNVDCIGIRDVLIHAFPDINNTVRGRAGLVIGGGATTRTAVFVLSGYFGIDRIYVVNRLNTEVDKLIEWMRRGNFKSQLTQVRTVEQAADCEIPAIAISAVPDLVPETEDEQQARDVSLKLLGLSRTSKLDKGIFLDMCYYPSPNTTLIMAAKTAGWQTLTGIDALIAINWAQSALWLDRPIHEIRTKEIDLKIRAAIEAHVLPWC